MRASAPSNDTRTRILLCIASIELNGRHGGLLGVRLPTMSNSDVVVCVSVVPGYFPLHVSTYTYLYSTCMLCMYER